MTDTTTHEAAEAAIMELHSPVGIEDPYPIYRRLRQLDPLHKSSLGFRIATRYADSVAILRDYRFIHDNESELTTKGYSGSWRDHPAMKHFYTNMLVKNPPEHTRLRRLVNRAFTPRVVEQMKPRVDARVAELLDQAGTAGQVEFIEAVAYPLPVSVIGDLVGVPRSEQQPFGGWVEDWSHQLELIMTPEGLAAADQAAQEMYDYFMTLIARRRSEPADDLTSALLAVEEDGERLSDEEIDHMLMLVFSAGFDTTMSLIANGLAALLDFPDQLSLLRAEPSLAPQAVEEMLRFDTSIQMTHREAAEDVEVAGRSIEAGEMVIVSVAGANRDPERFPEPDVFDILRSDNVPLSFGHGIHFCLGAALARMETAALFEALVARFARIEPTGDFVRRPRVHLRGFSSMPVRLTV